MAPLPPLPQGPDPPVTFSSLGRKRFQKAQIWARRLRSVASGWVLSLTYCCLEGVYVGQAPSLSVGSVGLLC